MEDGADACGAGSAMLSVTEHLVLTGRKPVPQESRPVENRPTEEEKLVTGDKGDIMDREVLERLLMDRALGALTPDVAAVLDAYVAMDAAAAARAREFDAAALAARQVLGPAMAEVPPFPAVRLARIDRTRRQLVLIRNVAGLAAAIVLGVVVGAWGFKPVAPFAGPGVVQATSRTVAAESGGFWSRERWLAAAQAARPSGHAALIWESPVERPRLRGES